MENKKGISDELLDKYLSGQCTEAEEAEVLDYMSQSDENIDDLMNIVAAIEAQKKATSHATKKVTRRFIPWSAAASVLLLVGLAWFFTSRNNGMQMYQSPAFAEQDTIEITDSITSEMLPYNEE
jgi:hypothetical protein